MKRYASIDIAKLIACFFVVGIHTALGSDFLGEKAYYFLSSGLFRLAVPFFFVTSGFFWGKKTSEKCTKEMLKKYLGRLAVPLLFWEIVNIIIEILKQYYVHSVGIKQICVNVITSILFYPYGALWYVQALIFSIVFVYFFLKKDKLYLCIVIGMLLYFVGLFANTYYFCVIGTRLQNIIDWYLKIFVSSRNAFFVGVFFVSVGVWLADVEKKIEVWKIISLFIMSCCFFSIEIIITYGVKFADDHSMYFSFVTLIPCLFLMIARMNLEIKKSALIRAYSSGIYFMHKPVIHAWLVFEKVIGFEFAGIVTSCAVLVLCILLCTIVFSIDDKRLKMLL